MVCTCLCLKVVNFDNFCRSLDISIPMLSLHYLWHTLRYRSYFSPTVRKILKIKRLKNCFKSLFLKCKVFFYIYWDHIMQKKYNSFVTCHILQPCNMSHFEKIENSGLTCGVKFFKFDFFLASFFKILACKSKKVHFLDLHAPVFL